MRKLQFWLGVESNRHSFYSDRRDLNILREDFTNLYHTYLDTPEKAAQLGIPETSREVIAKKVSTGLVTSADFILFFSAQEEVFKFMGYHYYPKFLQSELYFRFLEEYTKVKKDASSQLRRPPPSALLNSTSSHLKTEEASSLSHSLSTTPATPELPNDQDASSLSTYEKDEFIILGAEDQFETGTLTCDRMTIKIPAFTPMLQDAKKYIV
jgi:hypothetical protein